MIALAWFAAWIASSIPICWLAGRFIRVGMVELQSQQQENP